VLDEPTTGLHFSDIELLTHALLGLRDAGNTVLFIEHNVDLVACADWVVDLGPEGGEHGGQIVAQGPPELVADAEGSHTGRYLGTALEQARSTGGARRPSSASGLRPAARESRRTRVR
jgi:excinuclease ABC subunit A